MNKYLVAYSISLQETLQRRSTLLMDRLGGFAVVVSLYSFWSALLGDKPTFLGYTRPEMLTYVLMINILRSLVFTGRGWQLVGEISSGKISSYLVRPLSYHGYALSLDLAQKTIHVCSAFIEVLVLAALVQGGLFLPRDPATWLVFAASAALSSLIFFFMEFIVSSLAFWTSESGGPLFCFSSFSSSPRALLPSTSCPWARSRWRRRRSHLVYFPRVFLEKVPLSRPPTCSRPGNGWRSSDGCHVDLARGVRWLRGGGG